MRPAVSGNDLASIRAAAIALSPWAHIATVGKDGRPDVVPVHPCWEGDVLWILVGDDSVKAKNVRHNNHVENLEWCTRSENMKHAYDIGLKSRSKVQNPIPIPA